MIFKQKNQANLFKTILLVITILFNLTIKSQSPISQLRDSLKNIKLEKNSIDILLELCWEYRKVDVDSSIYFGKKAIILSRKNKKKRKEVMANRYLGISLKRIGKYEESLNYLDSAMFLARSLEDSLLIARLYHSRAAVKKNMGKYDDAMTLYSQSKEAIKELPKNKSYHEMMISVISGYGIIYKKLRDKDRELEYALKAYNYYKEYEDSLEDGNSQVINLAGCYSDIGEFDKAIKLFKEALIEERKINDKKGEAIVLEQIGIIYARKCTKSGSKCDQAFRYFRLANNVREEINDLEGLANGYGNLGWLYFLTNNFDSSIVLNQKSYGIAKQIKAIDEMLYATGHLVDTYKEMGDYENAFKYQERVMLLEDSINDEKKQKIIEGIREQYETEKKEQQIALLTEKEQVSSLKSKKDQLYIVSLSGGIGLLVILGSVVFLYYRNKQKSALELTQKDNVIEKQRSIQYKLKALSAQMNPHFIFNSLNSIQYYIVKNDIGNSKLFLRKFAGLMRKTLDNSEYTFISLEDELEALKEYIELERLRLDDQFEYSINVDSSIDPDDVNIPTLLIQPYVENAIWHGIAKKKEQGKITIEIKKEDDRILCIVDDNGIGRLKSQNIDNNNHKSYAMNITKARLDLINTLEDDIININIIDKKDKEGKPTGTTVQLFVPDDL